MSLTRSQMDAALQKLYDEIPAIPDCTGQCWISCGAIDMSDRERQRIRQAGFEITPIDQVGRKITDPTFYCEALTEDRRCAVYELRPLVCRLWGTTEQLKCPYGCVPAGGWLSDERAYEMIVEHIRIGGGAIKLPDTPEVRAVLASSYFKREMRRRHNIGRISEQHRIDGNIPAAFRRGNSNG